MDSETREQWQGRRKKTDRHCRGAEVVGGGIGSGIWLDRWYQLIAVQPISGGDWGGNLGHVSTGNGFLLDRWCRLSAAQPISL
jgi:hypothetical protein